MLGRDACNQLGRSPRRFRWIGLPLDSDSVKLAKTKAPCMDGIHNKQDRVITEIFKLRIICGLLFDLGEILEGFASSRSVFPPRVNYGE